MLSNFDKNAITELTVGGNLNSKDIETLKNLPNLAVLDMESANLETLPVRAFSNKESLTAVKLPKNLTAIEDDAFYKCSGLTGDLVIPESVTTIGNYAFYIRLSTIYCKAIVPPTISANTFSNWSSTLYVPIGCAEAYKAADYYWEIFNYNIYEMEF